MKIKSKVALIILDGWGVGPPWGGNAIIQAETPTMDYYWRRCPHTTLLAASEAVGLPPDSSGNSETGHLNIGAGRVVLQDLPFINTQIKNGSFFKNQNILRAFEHVKRNNSNLHLMGLISNGCVHADVSHLFSLVKMAKDNEITRVCLDLFTDGRDSDQNSALGIFDKVNYKLKEIGAGRITSICGRYFAMDRDKNWGRTSRAYQALTKGEAETSKSTRDAISKAYLRNISDEYIEPNIIIDENDNKTIINDNDSLILFNYRPDRSRQISKAFSPELLPELADRKILKNICFVTFVTREQNPVGIVAFNPKEIKNSLAETISNLGLKQFHIAETEKYAHVTYFINGGKEKPYPGEDNLMIPSPKVRTYDLAPQMSASKISEKLIVAASHNYDLLVCNYANADMVGHVGNYYAAVQAVEYVDQFLGKVINNLFKYNYTLVVTADHGNAEEMLNPKTNKPQTEHTKNPVPFIIISKQIEIARSRLLTGGALANVAPTILEIMGIEKPKEMTAESLIAKVNARI